MACRKNDIHVHFLVVGNEESKAVLAVDHADEAELGSGDDLTHFSGLPHAFYLGMQRHLHFVPVEGGVEELVLDLDVFDEVGILDVADAFAGDGHPPRHERLI